MCACIHPSPFYIFIFWAYLSIYLIISPFFSFIVMFVWNKFYTIYLQLMKYKEIWIQRIGRDEKSKIRIPGTILGCLISDSNFTIKIPSWGNYRGIDLTWRLNSTSAVHQCMSDQPTEADRTGILGHPLTCTAWAGVTVPSSLASS